MATTQFTQDTAAEDAARAQITSQPGYDPFATPDSIVQEQVYTQVYGTPVPTFGTTAPITPAPTSPTPTPTSPGVGTVSPAPSASGTPTDDQLLGGQQAFGDTDEGSRLNDYLTQLEQSLISGSYTDAQRAQIESAVESARQQYETLVRGAEREKAKGLPKALITAGQRGGLMNTQFAGVAATESTIGETFYGAGGVLETIKSDYDRNIDDLKSAQINAMSQARSMAEEAIRTGTIQNINAAQNMFNRAKALNDERNALIQQKLERVDAFNKEARELETYNRETAQATLDAMAAGGIDPETISDDYYRGLDQQAKWLPGTSKGVLTVAKKEREIKTTQDEIAVQNSLTELVSNLKVGAPPVTVNGIQYSVLSKGNTVTGTESGGSGRYLWSKDLETGDVSVTKLGDGDHGEYIDFPSTDGTVVKRVYADGYVDIFDANQPNSGYAQGGLIEKFPEGSITPFNRPAGKKAAAQCGAWVNDITGIGVGDSYENKVSHMDKSISAETAQIGDVFIQRAGTTGHIGIINGIFKDPETGEITFKISESNWSKDKNGIGIITHTRKISADLVTGFARPGFKDPSYQFGTDSTTGTQFGTGNGTNDTIAAYAKDYLSGKVASGNIPSEIRNQVITEAGKIREKYQNTPEIKALSNIGGLTADAKRGYESSILAALEEGDKGQVQSVIKNAVYDGANATTQAKLDGREQTLNALQTIQEELARYVAKNGDTNIFKGSMNAIARRVGNISDPELESIATRINAAMIDYRNAVSGAAFTESELKQYEKLFPSVKNVPKLNTTIIDTLIDTFGSASENFYRSRLGTANYDSIFGGTSTGPASQGSVEYGPYAPEVQSVIDQYIGMGLTMEEINEIIDLIR